MGLIPYRYVHYMTQTHTPIRLLITHREADEAVLVLARGLAQLPDFEVYLTREGISSPTEEEGVKLCPVWCAKLCRSRSRPS